VEQQFKHNLAHKERLYCRYDELSADNTHNQIIRYVLRLMMKMSIGVVVKKQLSELLMRFDGISDVHVTIATVDDLQFDRSNCRYEAILKQCHWFMQGLHPDVLAGHESCVTLLFDMNRLFESYVANIFKKLAWADGKRLRTQGPQKYMVWREDQNEKIFLMKPDMVFLDSKNRILSIADAKWKILDDREKKLGISQADLYQLVGYAMRYGTKQLALIYPRQKRLQSSIDLQLQGSKVRVKIVPVDIMPNSPPVGESFEMF
jgi:5-methylcytosine-specific restriction enzyme subunit McrC